MIGQLVAESPGASDVVVLGLSPGQARSLGETLTTAAVVGEVAPGQGLVLVPYAQAYAAGFEDMRRRVPSIEKISNLIGYRPTLNLDSILQTVIEFERARIEVA